MALIHLADYVEPSPEYWVVAEEMKIPYYQIFKGRKVLIGLIFTGGRWVERFRYPIFRRDHSSPQAIPSEDSDA